MKNTQLPTRGALGEISGVLYSLFLVLKSNPSLGRTVLG